MTRTQIQQLVVVLLLLLFVGVFLLSNKPPEPNQTTVTPAPAGQPAAENPAGTPEQAPAAPAAASAPLDLTIPRDVFLPPALLLQRLEQKQQEAEQQAQQQKAIAQAQPVTAQQVGITDLQLQGIFWGTSNPQAIINRKIVSVGDRVDDAEVEEITRESVRLSKNGQTFELKPVTFRVDKNQEGRGQQPWSSNNNLR